MTCSMTIVTRRRSRWAGGVLCATTLLAGCGSLLPAAPAQPALFLLEDGSSTTVDLPSTPARARATATLVVDEPRAAPGYGTRQMAYVRTPDRLEYFAFHQWVEPPAQMLAPILAKAVERTGAFRSVVRAPLSVAGDFRLETELVRLHQDFSTVPSVVRMTVHAVLVDTATRRVVATRDVDAESTSASEDPTGGVAAANRVAQRAAAEIGAFCAEWAVESK